MAVSIVSHTNSRDRYQALFLLAAIALCTTLSYLLWEDVHDVALIGLSWGISIGLVVSALVHMWWFNDKDTLCGCSLRENEFQRLDDEKSNRYV